MTGYQFSCWLLLLVQFFSQIQCRHSVTEELRHAGPLRRNERIHNFKKIRSKSMSFERCRPSTDTILDATNVHRENRSEEILGYVQIGAPTGQSKVVTTSQNVDIALKSVEEERKERPMIRAFQKWRQIDGYVKRSDYNILKRKYQKLIRERNMVSNKLRQLLSSPNNVSKRQLLECPSKSSNSLIDCDAQALRAMLAVEVERARKKFSQQLHSLYCQNVLLRSKLFSL